MGKMSVGLSEEGSSTHVQPRCGWSFIGLVLKFLPQRPLNCKNPNNVFLFYNDQKYSEPLTCKP